MPANSVLLLQIRAEVEKYRENKHTKYNVYKIPVIQKQYFLYRSRGKKEGGHKRGWYVFVLVGKTEFMACYSSKMKITF